MPNDSASAAGRGQRSEAEGQSAGCPLPESRFPTQYIAFNQALDS